VNFSAIGPARFGSQFTPGVGCWTGCCAHFSGQVKTSGL
jgi:hypothetical protein